MQEGRREISALAKKKEVEAEKRRSAAKGNSTKLQNALPEGDVKKGESVRGGKKKTEQGIHTEVDCK